MKGALSYPISCSLTPLFVKHSPRGLDSWKGTTPGLTIANLFTLQEGQGSAHWYSQTPLNGFSLVEDHCPKPARNLPLVFISCLPGALLSNLTQSGEAMGRSSSPPPCFPAVFSVSSKLTSAGRFPRRKGFLCLPLPSLLQLLSSQQTCAV